MPVFSLGDRRLTHSSDDWFIAPTATLVGSVHMGRGANIWFNCALRADGGAITLGDRCNVQDASMLHADLGCPVTLAEDVSIGHKVMLHGCSVGPGSLIGMNAVVLNGASIGAGSIVAAHSLVPEDKTYPDGVLIMGTPARVVRTLSDAEKSELVQIAAGYVERARRYRSELRLDSP
jgi:carbonic anhydrase/acetyltransferase-like protein (isoleucine patch superfamily)